MPHVFLTLLPKAPINTIVFMTAEGLDVTIPHFQHPPHKSWGQDGCDGSELAQDKMSLRRREKRAVPKRGPKMFNTLY